MVPFSLAVRIAKLLLASGFIRESPKYNLTLSKSPFLLLTSDLYLSQLYHASLKASESFTDGSKVDFPTKLHFLHTHIQDIQFFFLNSTYFRIFEITLSGNSFHFPGPVIGM